MSPSAPPPRHRAEIRPEQAGAPNYWLRRVGALAIVGLIGYAGAIAISGFFGGDDGPVQSAPGDSVATAGTGNTGSEAEASAAIDCSDDTEGELCDELGLAEDATVEEGGTVPAGDVESSEPPATDPEPENTGPPSPDNPAKVYIVGDSDAGTFGPYLETLLDGTLVTETELNYKVSSGLARPDFFNWPEELETKLPEVDPDIVVVTFGGNDSQGLSLPQDELEFMVGDPVSNEAEWSEEYQRRAGEVMDLLLEDDREVIWVGIPNDDNPDVTAALAIQDRAAKAAAAERPDVVFVDTWERFSGRDGGWAEFVVDPRDNDGKDVRADDGFHLNQTGAEILAIDIAIEVQNALRELGADL
ncbi:SGNH/GDSL hydrolase family protein [Ilumatobacter nonamiensis]|uniref:SGNH/GDSL hydrolase family protein n=1 Tax=Ilumatobacter nonamiensis TaxID=467093 RepID=UPI0009FBAEF0|nr:GDSL-type esterase/lipase family protein [Ilumatobacter nonamiensis]